MSEQQTRELIRALAEDLEPVRPIPSVRQALAAVLGIWALVAAVGLAVMGLRPDLAAALTSWNGVGSIFVGLGLAGLAGLAAALAAAIPGRERLVVAAVVVGLAGIALAAGVATALSLAGPAAELHAPWHGDLGCLGVALGVALLPALAITWFAGTAAPYRPVMVALAAAAGTAALGAVVAQAHCPVLVARHLMVGHVLAPGFGALLLSLPLLVALRRIGRGS